MASRKRGKGRSKKGSPPTSVSRSPPQPEADEIMPGLTGAGDGQSGEDSFSDATLDSPSTTSEIPAGNGGGGANGNGNAEEKEEAADVVAPLGQGTPKVSRRVLGGGSTSAKGVPRTSSYRGQDARMVYYDPGDVLPEKDKPMVPGGEKAAAEEALRYKQRWLFTPAIVLSAVDSEPGVSLIRTKDMEVHRVKTEKLRNVNTQAMEGVRDAMSLSDLSEASLLHTLRERYSRDEVYTRVGPVLMSINPYKWIKGLYTEAAMVAYHGKASMVEAGELAPHLFGVADHAYSQLVQGHLNAAAEAKEDMSERKSRASNQCNQSIIISGESGSGKTEATKIIMQYLARITSHTTKGGSSKGTAKSSPGGKAAGGEGSLHVGELEERVLSCNPLLESFGNAQTLKNDNSSRFGKFIKIQFDKKGRIIGAQIENYLLEKTRIVNQAKRERSYHVFYQLLAGASSEVKQALKLEKGVAGFECLKGSKAVSQDAEEFEVTKACLVKIGIDKTGQKEIFKLLAVVLHLLNVAFVSANEGEGCEVKQATKPSLTLAAEFLGVESEQLEKALVSKTMAVHRGSTTMLQTKEQAHDKAGALGKGLYSQLFLWLVARLNTTIAAPNSNDWGFIGVLDIYGFEHFNVNSLEQLLINYANEQLQRHFNQHMFEVEQCEYEKEQIDWSYIKFNDNKACLELIDGRPGGKAGVLAALDDIQRFKGGEANTQFLSHLRNNFAATSGGGVGVGRVRIAPSVAVDRGGHPHFLVPRFDENSSFGIKHYAGDVIYSIRNFNEKNRENLSKDIKELVGQSTNDLVKEVFAVGADDGGDDDNDDTSLSGTPGGGRGRGGGGGRIREASVGAQFKQSLAGLIGTISTTQPRYIRCVKPNPDKERDRIDAMEVLRQLQYSGMMETIRIRQQGYALRELHDDFFRKYVVLEPKTNDVEELVALLSKNLGVSQENWQIGNSKVFLRNSMSDKLNVLVDLRKKSATRVIQRWIRYTKRRNAVRYKIQPFLRNSVVILKYMRAAAYFKDLTLKRRSAAAILGWYRHVKRWRRIRNMHAAAVVIQSYARRRFAIRHFQIRKEFPDTPADQLFVKVEGLRVKRDEAIKANDFAACRELDSRILHMEHLAERRGIGTKSSIGGSPDGGSGDDGPSRQEIEIRLLEAVWRMADAEAEQDYSLCSNLQRDMKELEDLREQKPTLAELTERIEQVKADIDKFAAQADYGRAGSLQTKLVEMEEKIVAMEEEKARADSQQGGTGVAGKFSEMSPTELEDLTTKTREELDVAKGKRDFAKCIELQAKWTELSAASASMPTLAQVEEEVLNAETEMAAAKARKDYRRAAELSVKLPAMHDRHSALALSIRKAMGRKQLAEEIQRLEGEMRLSKAEKRFNKCSLLQRDLEELHKLTEALPTVADLEDELYEVRSKMDDAVSQRKYAEAEQHRARITELAEEKALAIEQEQSSPSPKDPSASSRMRRRSSFPLGEKSPRGSGIISDIRAQEAVPPPPPPVKDPIFTSPQPIHVQPLGGGSPMSARVPVPTPARITTIRGPGLGGSAPKDGRTVSRLRPKPAVTIPQDATVAEVCVALARARSDAGLLTGAGGVMTGILTAIDLTRRVVAVGVDPSTTLVSEVMTPNPTTVRTDDGAMEALGIMMDRHFRHLPVKNPSGDVVGVLDIAKCLYDAVSRLEKASNVDKSSEVAGSSEGGLQQSVLAELGKSKGKKGKAAMAALLAKLFEEQGGDASSTLGHLLEKKGVPQFVRSDDRVRAAGRAIARGRKAVLVVDGTGLVGIFTEKDLLNRVLAKGLDPDHTSVAEVMTPNPDTVPSTMTVLGALQEMHQNKYLHLPVIDESIGTVSGVVNVMEIMQATAGEEGSSGWKALFGSALDTGDDFSDSASMASTSSVGTRSGRRAIPRVSAAPSVASTSNSQTVRKADARPVSVLKPKPPLSLSSGLTLFEVAKKMADIRTDAAILLDAHGQVEGIVTDHDITRRALAHRLNPQMTFISEVMTPNPTMVRMDDDAMTCLGIMVERRFRHLPVVDGSGIIAGVLSIAKCLYDAIHRLEKKAMRAEEKAASGGDSSDLAASFLKAASAAKGKGRGNKKAKDLTAVLAMILADGSGDDAESEPTLGDILAEETATFVNTRDTATSAAIAISKGKKAVLALDDGRIAGILTPKDLLNRVVAKGLNPDTIRVSAIMTPNPDTVPPEMTVLDALREMHENKYLHLPVVNETTGAVEGVVNVMEIVQATAGSRGSSRWEAFFGSAMDATDDVSDSASMYSIDYSVRSTRSVRPGGLKGRDNVSRADTASVAGSARTKSAEKRKLVSSLKPKPPLSLSSGLTLFEVAKKMADIRTDAAILLDAHGQVEGIVTDHDITRRALAHRLNPQMTFISEVMTPNPTMVRMDDDAMTCLGIMVERRFRHLPVVDGSGIIAGVLSIAKCLYDAIHRLEKKAMRAEEKAASGGDSSDLAASFLKAASAAKGKGRGNKKAKDLTAVLAMLMADNSGDGAESEPTLGDILAEETATFVNARDTATSAAIAISKGKKAVLALDDGRIAGILTPKDLLNRVVAKGLNPDTTRVSAIMTPNPDTVPPEMTVLDALREMHENKYLHLPVVNETTGAVEGVVNVMEIVQATAGSRGSSRWEAFFGSAMDATDDVSDSASMYSIDHSVRSMRSVRPGVLKGHDSVSRAGTASVAGSTRTKLAEQHRPVSSLKPKNDSEREMRLSQLEGAVPCSLGEGMKRANTQTKRPLCLDVELTVTQVAKKMAESRTDAVILLGAQGDMKGILTDSDVARKVVGGSLDASRTPVADVMTPNPLWVNSTDSAMGALGTMLEKHFRHLPVVDGEGTVSGLLNIAKCLYDAIHRLEKKALKAEEENTRGGGGDDIAASVLKLQAKRALGKGGKNAKALAAMAALLQGLDDGEEEPTLGSILAHQSGVLVDAEDTAADAGRAIARSKKAVLALNHGQLAGIVTPKDILMRVVAKGLNPENTFVCDIMTPNPDTVLPDMTVVDALREMHENKYLHLPVLDERNGVVVGVVNVMEIIQAVAGNKGSERWEAFFGSAMDAGDDLSDSASMYSMDKSVRSLRSARRGSVGQVSGGGRDSLNPGVAASVSGSIMTSSKKEKPLRKDDRPVSRLRLKRPIIMPCDGSVLDVAMEMAHRRTDAALLTKRGAVVGIVTDHDLTRRVIALDKAPDRTAVREVMTPEPTTVTMDEGAMAALSLMLDNRTRHLPVMDSMGKVAGLVDIAKCLYDAVHRMEKQVRKKQEEEGSDEDDDSTLVLGAMMEAAKAVNKDKASAKNQKALQELMMMAISSSEDSREGANKTLGDVLASKEKAEFVRPRHTVREAASVIAAQKKAVLVVEEGELVGIFTPRDMLNRVIAKRLSPSTTAVSSVMTANPDGGPPSLTVLQALQQMCDNRYLHMPVVENTGEVIGVVDVMEIIEVMVGQQGSSGWEAFFGSAMRQDDDPSDTMSQGSMRSHSRSNYSTSRRHTTPSASTKSPEALGSAQQAFAVASRAGARVGMGATVARVPGLGMEPRQIPNVNIGDGASEISRDVGGLELEEGWDEKFVYKVSDDAGHTYKFKASAERLDAVLQAVSDKLKMPKESILLKYADDDGDEIVLSGDDSLHEAIDMARGSSAPALKLIASAKLQTLEEGDDDNPVVTATGTSQNFVLIGAAVAGVAVLVVVGIVLSRKKA